MEILGEDVWEQKRGSYIKCLERVEKIEKALRKTIFEKKKSIERW